MIAVSLLGRVAVSVDGAAIAGEAAQRRRVALLALLCTPPARPLSRDRLMLYLWPDSDVESARHLLSVAVHVLRKALGHDVVLTTADEVSVAPGTIEVDVAAFEEAVARGDHEAAVASYGGPFMDGFHAGAGVELEQWIDGERTRLQRMYGQSLEGLAERCRAAGDAPGAVEAWRKLALLDPFSSHTALGLMHALADAGNRAAAIRHAGVHRQLLEGELGAGPDPEVETLAEQLRTEPTPPAPAVELPAPATSSPAAPAAPSAPGVPETTSPEVAAWAAAASVSAGIGGVVPAPMSAASFAVLAPDGPHEVPVHRVSTPRHGGRWAAVALVLVGLGLVGFFARHWLAREPKVAVLPFRCDPDSALGDGIAEQIIDQLTRVPGLRVVARTSSFAFRSGQVDARVIGDSLAAQNVLEGTCQHSGNRIRIMVRLVSTEENVTLWSEQYQEPYEERLAVEDSIARMVVHRMTGRTLAANPDTPDPKANELYVEARREWYKRNPASLRHAVTLFQQAVAQDATYALAYAGLAETLIVAGSYDYGLLTPDSAYPAALWAAQRALQLQPRLAEAHAALGAVYQNYNWAPKAAEDEFRKAIDEEPDYSPARQWYGLLLASQRKDEQALQQLRRAAETDPTSPVLFATRAQYFYYTRNFSQAVKQAQQALGLDLAFGPAHLIMALAEIQLGHAPEAVQRVETVAQASPEPVVLAVLAYARGRAGNHAGALAARDLLTRAARQRYVPPELFALADIGVGDLEAAMRQLEEAKKLRSNGMAYLAVEPALDTLRSDPRTAGRFVALTRAVAAATMPVPKADR